MRQRSYSSHEEEPDYSNIMEKYGHPSFDYDDAAPNETSGTESKIKLTCSGDNMAEVDAVEEEEDLWMQPQHEYKVPDNWESNRTTMKMWTTDFSENEPQLEDSKQGEPEINVDTVRGCWENATPVGVKSQDDVLNGSASQISNDSTNHSYEIEMEEITSPTTIVSSANSTPIKTISQSKPVIKPQPPEIVLTVVKDKKASTPLSSYATALQAEKEERDAQSAFAKEVFQQIQSFGEAADDEFDVQWATTAPVKHTTTTHFQKDVFESANSYSPDSQPTQAIGVMVASSAEAAPAAQKQHQEEPKQVDKATSEETVRTSDQQPVVSRANPFLNSPEEDEDHDGIVVEQVGLDSEDKDFSVEAEQYYKSRNPYFAHRPGHGNTEGRYHARDFERRPLHGTTIPPLIPDNVLSRRRAASNVTNALQNGALPHWQQQPQTCAYNLITGSNTLAKTSPLTESTQDQSSPAPVLTPTRTAPPPHLMWLQKIPYPKMAQHSSMPPSYAAHLDALKQQQEQQQHRFTTDIAQAEDLLPANQVHSQLNWRLDKPQDQKQVLFTAPGAENTPTLGSSLPSASHTPLLQNGSLEESEGDGVASPRLKRSPAMILGTSLTSSSGDKAAYTINTSYLYNVGKKNVSNTFAPDTTFQEDVPCKQQAAPTSNTTTNNNNSIFDTMGRRRLPSLPAPTSFAQSSTYLPSQDHPSTAHSLPTSTSQLPTSAQIYYSGLIPLSTASSSSPLYYTSSAPERKDVAVNGGPGGATSLIIFDSSTSAASTLSQALHRPYPPPSSQSRPQSAAGSLFHSPGQSYHPSDPAILPGATYKQPPVKTQRLTSFAAPVTSNNKAACDTVNQLRFKKELRERLANRKLALEACEIEANHREYAINKMLHSGLMPASLRLLPISMAELEAIPSVIKCQLPAELIKGAKVVPGRTGLATTSAASQANGSLLENLYVKEYERGLRAEPPSSHNILVPSPTKRSIGCQSDAALPTTTAPSSRTSGLSNTSLKLQLKANQHNNRGPARGPSTSAMVDHETQTSSYVPEWTGSNTAAPTTNYGQKSSRAPVVLTSSSYLSAKDDRRRNPHPRFFNPTPESWEDAERKRREVQLELDWRRHRLSSMVDLRQLAEDPVNLRPMPFPSSSSDYSSTVPHYGSLPRIGSSNWANQTQQAAAPLPCYRYGSLPRNYERFMEGNGDSYGYRPTQPLDFGGSSNPWESSTAEWPRATQPSDTPYSRSINYLDLDSQQAGVDRRPDLLSQYANYLNQQFMLEQEQLPLNAADYSARPAPPSGQLLDWPTAPALQSLPPHLAAEYPMRMSASSKLEEDLLKMAYQEEEQERQRMIHDPLFQQPPSTGLPWPAREEPLYYPPPVYSRGEANYGSRPTNLEMGNYGNYLRNRAQSLRQLDRLQQHQDMVNQNARLHYPQYSTLQPQQMSSSADMFPNYSQRPGYGAVAEQMRYAQRGYGREMEGDGLNKVMQEYNKNSSTFNFPRQQHQNYETNRGAPLMGSSSYGYSQQGNTRASRSMDGGGFGRYGVYHNNNLDLLGDGRIGSIMAPFSLFDGR
uniref:Uncharacterized protein n=1 Tax=Ditylenchus dipsaci TaxID=166011 RepID=A0A915CSX5_9BILA